MGISYPLFLCNKPFNRKAILEITEIDNSITTKPIKSIFKYMNVVSIFVNKEASLKYKIEESKIILFIVEENPLYIRIIEAKSRISKNSLDQVLVILSFIDWGRTKNAFILIAKTTKTVINNSIGDFASPRKKEDEKYVGLINSWNSK